MSDNPKRKSEALITFDDESNSRNDVAAELQSIFDASNTNTAGGNQLSNDMNSNSFDRMKVVGILRASNQQNIIAVQSNPSSMSPSSSSVSLSTNSTSTSNSDDQLRPPPIPPKTNAKHRLPALLKQIDEQQEMNNRRLPKPANETVNGNGNSNGNSSQPPDRTESERQQTAVDSNENSNGASNDLLNEDALNMLEQRPRKSDLMQLSLSIFEFDPIFSKNQPTRQPTIGGASSFVNQPSANVAAYMNSLHSAAMMNSMGTPHAITYNGSMPHYGAPGLMPFGAGYNAYPTQFAACNPMQMQMQMAVPNVATNLATLGNFPPFFSPAQLASGQSEVSAQFNTAASSPDASASALCAPMSDVSATSSNNSSSNGSNEFPAAPNATEFRDPFSIDELMHAARKRERNVNESASASASVVTSAAASATASEPKPAAEVTSPAAAAAPTSKSNEDRKSETKSGSSSTVSQSSTQALAERCAAALCQAHREIERKAAEAQAAERKGSVAAATSERKSSSHGSHSHNHSHGHNHRRGGDCDQCPRCGSVRAGSPKHSGSGSGVGSAASSGPITPDQVLVRVSLESVEYSCDADVHNFLHSVVASARAEAPWSEQPAVTDSLLRVALSGEREISTAEASCVLKLTVFVAFLSDERFTVECVSDAEVSQVIYQLLYGELERAVRVSQVGPDSFLLRVRGTLEYMHNSQRLCDHLYVQKCVRENEPIRLVLESVEQIDPANLLTRTPADVNMLKQTQPLLPRSKAINRQNLTEVLNTLHNEARKLWRCLDDPRSLGDVVRTLSGVVQMAKAFLTVIQNARTYEYATCYYQLTQFQALLEQQMQTDDHCDMLQIRDSLWRIVENLIGAVYRTLKLYCETMGLDFRPQLDGPPERIRKIERGSKRSTRENFAGVSTSSNLIHDIFSIRIVAVARLPQKWLHTYSTFIVRCAVLYGNRQLSVLVNSQPVTSGTRLGLLTFDQQVTFQIADQHNPSERNPLLVNQLPREATIQCQLIGVTCKRVSSQSGASTGSGSVRQRTAAQGRQHQIGGSLHHRSNTAANGDQPTGGENYQEVRTVIGVTCLSLFDGNENARSGTILLPFWHVEYPEQNEDGSASTVFGCADFSIINEPNCLHCASAFLELELPDFGPQVRYPEVNALAISDTDTYELGWLHPETCERLREILERNCVAELSEEEKDLVWEKRFYLTRYADALPLVLFCAPEHTWHSPSHLAEVYGLLEVWSDVTIREILFILGPNIPDRHVRSKAIEWLGFLPIEALLLCLPQLVQALKYEPFISSALAKFLLAQAYKSNAFAHRFYWLLKDVVQNLTYWNMHYQLVFSALIYVLHEDMRRELAAEEDFVKLLTQIAISVQQNAKERDATLTNALERDVYEFFRARRIRLPLEVGWQLTGIDLRACSYFTSNSFPLKLAFRTVDVDSVVSVMFKIGDDLRQDLLTLQLFKLFDALWLREGLDLRMVHYRVLPLSFKQGLVELVSDCDTLRRIQAEQGALLGPKKDAAIANWLRRFNPTAQEYKRSVDNFTRSCAASCVATYVLGVCDRHNDNVMVRQSGQMFHIDFGKFFGDAEKYANIRRDRVPFILTAEMAYVINGDDRPTEAFQEFIDTCCRALNILRRYKEYLLGFVRLMFDAGMPIVNRAALQYVQNALMCTADDAEATAAFTRMIEKSLKCWFTQFNFLCHNLAQLKYARHSDGRLFEWTTRTYTMHTDGRICDLQLIGYRRRYDASSATELDRADRPSKFYVYLVRIERKQGGRQVVFRSFAQFQDLRTKLLTLFPLVDFVRFTRRGVASNVPLLRAATGNSAAASQAVGAVRFVERRQIELNLFCNQLLQAAPEIAQCDLIYTFFHPTASDEQQFNEMQSGDSAQQQTAASNALTLSRMQLNDQPAQIKLSVIYKRAEDSLTIFVQHVKGLLGERGDAPSTYVKTYLMPDPQKITKRKTRIVSSSFNPSFNEALIYRMPADSISWRRLQVSVWAYERLRENVLLGAVSIALPELMKTATKDDPSFELLDTWHQLGATNP